MVNANKAKGDKHEREAVNAFLELCPDLCVWNAQRLLGAGRKEDVGDLLVIDDVAVQVKAFKRESLSAAIYDAANGAVVQAGHARKDFALGMAVVPRARKDKVRWACVVHTWPTDTQIHDTASSAVAAVDKVVAAGIEAEYTVQVIRKGAAPVILSSLPTWVRAYRAATGRHNLEEVA